MKTDYAGYSKKGGVYRITNLTNRKIYIGSAKCFQVRKAQHLTSLRNNRHQNKHLQASFNKYGEDTFLFEVVEVVEDNNKENRFVVEQKYIDKLIKEGKWEDTFNFKKESIQKERSSFSKNPEETRRRKREAIKKRMSDPEQRKKIETALSIGQKTGFVKGRKHTKETREKMSANKLGKKKSAETRKRMSEARKGMESTFKGKKQSREAKEKISEVQKGNKNWLGRKHTEKSIEKMKMNNTNRKPVVLWDTKFAREVCFDSISDAASYMGVCIEAVVKAASRGRPIKGQYYAIYSRGIK